MRPFRALAAQSPAIVIATAALVLSVSGGAYAASAISSQHAKPAAVAAGNTFTFHDLTLLNGWKTFTGRGNPGVAVSGNTVRLRGEMSTTGNNTFFARLPLGARPAHTLDMVISTGGGGPALLVITKTGAMTVQGGLSTSFTALSGVSFTTNS
jgi:hypothetical protein